MPIPACHTLRARRTDQGAARTVRRYVGRSKAMPRSTWSIHKFRFWTGRGTTVKLQLESGRIWLKVKKLDFGSSFKVMAPNDIGIDVEGAEALPGTRSGDAEFMVDIDGEGYVNVLDSSAVVHVTGPNETDRT